MLRRLKSLGLLVLIFALSGAALADAQSERRALVGIKLFPTLLAADQDLAGKRCADGTLQLVVLHTGEPAHAMQLAERLREIREIKGMAFTITIASAEGLSEIHQPVAGIYLAQRVETLEPIIGFGRSENAIVFSPFEGDVERGSTAGLAISDRILPHVNLHALKEAGIRIKPFFLEVSKRHE